MVERVALGQGFLAYFGFRQSVSLHHSSVLIFTCMLILPEGKTKPEKLPKRDATTRTSHPLFLFPQNSGFEWLIASIWN